MKDAGFGLRLLLYNGEKGGMHMVEVRALTPTDDLTAVGELYALSWKHHYMGILPDTYLERLTGDRWSALLWADPSSSIAAFEDGKPLGAATLAFPRDEEREGYGEVTSIYLHPEAKNRGLGRKLMEKAMQQLRDEGCENVCVWVMEPCRSAIGFYEHIGFRFSGRKNQEMYGGRVITLLEYIRRL